MIAHQHDMVELCNQPMLKDQSKAWWTFLVVQQLLGFRASPLSRSDKWWFYPPTVSDCLSPVTVSRLTQNDQIDLSPDENVIASEDAKDSTSATLFV